MHLKKHKAVIISIAVILIILIVIYQLTNGPQKSGFGTEKTYKLLSINYKADCANALIRGTFNGYQTCFDQYDFDSTYTLTIAGDKIIISAAGKEQAILYLKSVEQTTIIWNSPALKYNISSIDIINESDPRLKVLNNILSYGSMYMTSNGDLHGLATIDNMQYYAKNLYITFTS
jgi:hypothetical protein